MSPFAQRSFRAGRALSVVLLTITAAVSTTFIHHRAADAAAHEGRRASPSIIGHRHRASARFLHFSTDTDTVSVVLAPQTDTGPTPYGVRTYVYSFSATVPSPD